MKTVQGIRNKYQHNKPTRRSANSPNSRKLTSSHCIKSYPCAKRGIHTREADTSWYKLQSSSLLGNRHCNVVPLFLCQNYLFIFLFWSRLGLSISDLALAVSVYPCCHSLSDGVQFLNLHRFSLTPSWHALFLICSILTVHHSHPLQPCRISSCSPYRFPFPAPFFPQPARC